MYIGERLVKIPYQQYTLSLQHASIRKLTIMEWSLLRIVKDYSTKRGLGNNTLAHFYEEILGMDNCEMLLKPCINGLINLEMVQIEGFTDTSVVTRIKLNEVKITEKGLTSLKDGYLLGQSQETEEIVFWDIISKAFMDHVEDYSDQDTAHSAKSLGKKKAGKVAFAPENFLQAVNAGEVFKAKYYSGGRWVESAVCADEKEQWRTTLLVLEQTKDKVLKTNLPVDDEVYDQLIKMTGCPFGRADNATDWDSDGISALPDEGLFGAKLIRTLQSSIEYCDTVITTEAVYTALYSEDSKVFDGKQVILLGASAFQIDDFNGLIYLPINLPISNLVYLTDKKDAYGLYVKHTVIEDKPIDVFFVQSLMVPANVFPTMINENIDSFSKTPELLAVFGMPIFRTARGKLDTIYRQEISQCTDLRNTIQYATRVAAAARRIHVEPFTPDPVLQQIKKYLNFADLEALIADIKYVYQYYLNQYADEFFLRLLIEAALEYSGPNRIKSIETILSTATRLLSRFDNTSFGVEASRRLALTIHPTDYDELYSGMSDPLMDAKGCVFSAFTEYANFYEATKSVESLIPDFVFVAATDRDSLLAKMLECPNLVQVKHDVELMLATASRHSDCEYFSKGNLWINAKLIKDILDLFILPDGEPANIYIIDTCAFIHTPDILDYFQDNEIVRVPHTVLLELDKHKDNKGNPIHTDAAAACRSIEAHTTQAKLGNLLTFEMEPNDYPELLPIGFAYGNKDRLSPDNMILSTAFRYKAFRPTIVTDDTNFRNISRSQGIGAIAWNVFIDSRGGKAIRSSGHKKQSTATPVSVQPVVVAPVEAKKAEPVIAAPKRKINRASWLNRPITDLSLPEIGVPMKITKALAACGFPTINSLMMATDFQLKQKIKASAVRTGAYNAKDKFNSFVQHPPEMPVIQSEGMQDETQVIQNVENAGQTETNTLEAETAIHVNESALPKTTDFSSVPVTEVDAAPAGESGSHDERQVDQVKQLVLTEDNIGQTVFFGHFQCSADLSGNTAPLEWIVVDSFNGRALLLSRYVIDSMPYRLSPTSSWENSDIREWLNSSFLSKAFTEDEQKQITLTTIQTAYKGKTEETQDKAFLLSVDDIGQYAAQLGDELAAFPTPYAEWHGVRSDSSSGGRCSWWLRSPRKKNDPKLASAIRYSAETTWFDIHSGFVGVRPAIWVGNNMTAEPLQPVEDTSTENADIPVDQVIPSAPILEDATKTIAEPHEELSVPSDVTNAEQLVSEEESVDGEANQEIQTDGFSIGQTIIFGRYYQTNENDLEDIEWIVLDKDEDEYLIVSKYALDIKAFAEEGTQSNWRKSSIRQWLNGEFLNTAFTPGEQQYIVTRQVFCDAENSSPACTVADSFPTKDKVFLLSYREAAQYFSSDEERIAYGTPYTGLLALQDPHYAPSNSQIVLPDRCRWLLRTSGPNNYSVSCVHETGNIDVNSGVKTRKMVRPAMWICTDNPDDSQATTTETQFAAPAGFLEYYIFSEKTSYCPFDSALLTQEAVQVEHRDGTIKKLNFQVCHVCNRLYSRNSSNTINLQDYKLTRRLLPSQIAPNQVQTYYQLKEKTSICPIDGGTLSYEVVSVALINDANTTKKLHMQRCACCGRIFIHKVSESVHLELFALNRIDLV